MIELIGALYMRFNLKLEDVKYLKLLYKDASGNPVTSKAAIRRVNDREMLICAKYDENLNLTTPQNVTLSIVCNDGLYRTTTTLKSVSKEEPYTFFVLEPPQGLEYQQNREYFRVVVAYQCWINPSRDSENTVETTTHDVSANGVSVISNTHFALKDDTIMILNLDGRKIQTSVRFVRSERVNDDYKLSFTFTKISEQDRDFISQALIKKQLEDKRNSIS